MKQTAVEWLEDNLLSEPWTEEHFKYNAECWDKAKEMEKEQIIEAAYEFMGTNFDSNRGRAELYYKEKYKQQEQ